MKIEKINFEFFTLNIFFNKKLSKFSWWQRRGGPNKCLFLKRHWTTNLSISKSFKKLLNQNQSLVVCKKNTFFADLLWSSFFFRHHDVCLQNQKPTIFVFTEFVRTDDLVHWNKGVTRCPRPFWRKKVKIIWPTVGVFVY